jgi:hypothetical protein
MWMEKLGINSVMMLISERSIDKVGIVLHVPLFHPAMKT